MGFVLIRFQTDSSVIDFASQIESVKGFTSQGDWHDFRLQSVVQAGLGIDSAPAKSIERDRSKHGKAILLQLELENGQQMTGQIRNGGLLLSCRSVLASDLSHDAHVQALIQAVQALARDVEVEIG